MTTDTTNTAPRACSLADAAKSLNISKRTLERMIKAGEIHSVKVSTRRRVVPETEIVRILAGEVVAS